MHISRERIFELEKEAGCFARYVTLVLISSYTSDDGRWILDRNDFMERDGCDRYKFHHVMKKFRSMGIIKKEGNSYEILDSSFEYPLTTQKHDRNR